MPGVHLDDGTWKSILVPSTTTIGRGSGNDIQPDSQSISKKHAQLQLQIDHKGRLVCEITDFDSRNGTFHGPSPYDREMQRVTGTQKIEYGSYLKFGNSHSYFQMLENQPVGTPLAYEPPPAGMETGAAKAGAGRESTDSAFAVSGGTADTAQVVPLLPPSSSGEPAAGPQRAMARSMDPDNMMISIQYPTGQQKPVSIHIDPQGQGPPAAAAAAATGGGGGYGGYSDSNRSSRDYRDGYRDRERDEQLSSPQHMRGGAGVRNSLGNSRSWEDVVLERVGGAGMGSPGSSQGGGGGGNISRGVQRYNSQLDTSVEEEGFDRLLPPPLGGHEPEQGGVSLPLRSLGGAPVPLLPPAAVASLDASNSRGLGYGQMQQQHQMQQQLQVVPTSPAKGNFPFEYPGKPKLDDKPDAQLVRRIWPDMELLQITRLTSEVLEELVENQVHAEYNEESPLPTVEEMEEEVPPFVAAEAAADRFLDSEDTVCGRLGGVVNELNDLLEQALVGAQIQTPRTSGEGVGGGGGVSLGGAAGTGVDAVQAAISSELDAALVSIVNDILVNSINTLQSCLRHSLVGALQLADTEVDEHGRPVFPNDINLLLRNACSRLERLLSFFNKSWLTSLATRARSSESYAICCFCLHCVLSELDIGSALLHSVCLEAAEIDQAKSKRKSRKGRGHGLSLELEIGELRRLKAKSKARGGNPAIAAQIAQLEKSTRDRGAVDDSMDLGDAFVPPSGPGEQSQRYTDMELKRVREQEKGAKVPTKKLLRACRAIDNNNLKFQYWLFRRWKNIVMDMKKGYFAKLNRFSRILTYFGHTALRQVFRRWERNTRATRAEQELDQVRAELRYEMCGMAYKIHELTSQNTLAASLAAERALNMELTDLNMQLRKSVTELDTKLLECANALPSKRKLLVRDVLFGREDEVSFARRESKALRDELQALYDLSIKMPDKPLEKVLPKAPVPNTYGRAKDINEMLPPKDGKAKFNENGRSTSPLHDKLQHTRPLQHRAHRGELSVENPNRPLVAGAQPRGGSRNKVLAPVQGKFLDRDNREMTNGISKKDAAIIIAKEVRRLSETLQKSESMKAVYAKRLTHDATKHMQQRLALQALQRRITDRERSLTALRHLLKQRLGDTGLMDLTLALEDMGVGNSALLKDPASLEDPSRREYNNVPPIEPFRLGAQGIVGTNGESADAPEGGKVPVLKQRESYKDAIDDSLDYESPEKRDAAENAKRAVLVESAREIERINTDSNELLNEGRRAPGAKGPMGVLGESEKDQWGRLD